MYRHVIKRLIDIVLSLVGLIVLAIPMLVFALIVKLDSPGPVLFWQKRVGIHKKTFMMPKFRSMYTETPAEMPTHMLKDPEKWITPVGRAIRRTSLDELPQIFCILFTGDMSIVGPRPERREIFEQYEESIPEFKFRLKMKAGLTGYAQVYGQYNTVPYDKLKLDLTYIENYSLWLDIKLCFLTVKILFQKEKSEGVDGNQTTALK